MKFSLSPSQPLGFTDAEWNMLHGHSLRFLSSIDLLTSRLLSANMAPRPLSYSVPMNVL